MGDIGQGGEHRRRRRGHAWILTGRQPTAGIVASRAGIRQPDIRV